ncbi:hypothetical protein EQV77_04130 [Halobacillus fulvus]|nr:hypothetical protein EQV77_04130 [Halobacillus fulvus]
MNSVKPLVAANPASFMVSTSNEKAPAGFGQLLAQLAGSTSSEDSADEQTGIETLLKKLKALLEEAGVQMETVSLTGTSLDEGSTLSELGWNWEDSPTKQKQGLIELEALLVPVMEKHESLAEPVEEMLNLLNQQISQEGQKHASQAVAQLVMTSAGSALPAQQENHLHNLWQQFQQLTLPLTAEGAQQSPVMDQSSLLKLKQVLHDIHSLLKHHPVQGKQVLESLMNAGKESQKQTFQSLFQSYQNRVSIPHGYKQQAPVRAEDVAKWIAQTVEKTAKTGETVTAKSISPHQPMPMSKVEQFVIHINQTESNQNQQKQLIQEFERVLKNSRLFMNKAGGSEIHLKLRPAHLGDIQIKMVQMNGEMTARILVSSQAAKDMIETNMNQIRHLFSPQQVVVERQENTTWLQQQDPSMKKEQQDGEQKRDNDQRDEQNERSEEEDVSFRELLMNEEV